MTLFSPSRSRALLIAGGTAWGLWYLGMDLVGWGEPGSDAYRRYEQYNRALPLVLVLLAGATEGARRHFLPPGSFRQGRAGAALALLGLLAMLAGNVLEFWLFSLTPYAAGSLRGYGWGTYCIGLLGFYLGTAWLGLILVHSPRARLPGTLLMLWLPSGAVLFLLDRFLDLGDAGFTVATAMCGAAYLLLGLGLESRPRSSGVAEEPSAA